MPTQAKADTGAARDALELAEGAFLRDVAQNPAKAYESALAADGRVYRPGHFPAIGKADATALVQAAATPNVTYTRAEAGVSRSADFAYVFGTAELAPARADAKPGTFLRVWRRTSDGGWRLALDVLDPPAAPK
jgi:ketosteroid isomerase-like protein